MQANNLYTLLQQKKCLDLSHTLDNSIPSWDKPPILQKETIENYENGYFTEKVQFYTGIGTHIDAPMHFYKGQTEIQDLQLKQLFCETYLINVEKQIEQFGSNYSIIDEDLKKFESENEILKESSLVLFYTGWAKYWNEKEKYQNINKENQFVFPTLNQSAAEVLVKRKVAGIGIDTLSPDIQSDFTAHKLLLGNNIYIIENINEQAKLLPKAGSVTIISPLKIKGCAEAPIRMFSFF